jgi:uncharacterized protein (DUF885 family)
MLFATAAAGFAAAGGAPSLAKSAESPVARLNALFDEIMARQLRSSPETATGLGLDTGELAWTKSQLGDRSFAAIKAAEALNARELVALRGIDRHALSGMDAVNYDTVEFVLSVLDEGNRQFSYGGGGSGPTPICRGWKPSPG